MGMNHEAVLDPGNLRLSKLITYSVALITICWQFICMPEIDTEQRACQ